MGMRRVRLETWGQQGDTLMGELSKDAREALVEFNVVQTDWYGTCRRCGKRLTGTIQQIREHICDAVSS